VVVPAQPGRPETPQQDVGDCGSERRGSASATAGSARTGPPTAPGGLGYRWV